MGNCANCPYMTVKEIGGELKMWCSKQLDFIPRDPDKRIYLCRRGG